ncbi:MAG TPA: CapA family protein [Candidatus Binatia bacterium]|jgi:poly-gamma-glutamate synthesis protein (capsule biosynthesis protein)|nr:CapA family protein [Candidatus Binatia bacterium]
MFRIRHILFLSITLVAVSGCRTPAELPTVAPSADNHALSAGVAEAQPTHLAAMPTPEAIAVEPIASPITTPTAAPTAAPSATSSPWRVAVEPGVPSELVAAMRDLLEEQPGEFVMAGGSEPADVTLRVGGSELLATWVYAVAVPFATVDDTTTLAELQANWRNGGAPQALVDETSGPLLTTLWGQGTARLVDSQELVAQLWQQRPAWSVLPFQHLDPSLKVLDVDGVSPLDDDFDAATYALAIGEGLDGDPEAVAAVRDAWNGPRTNRDAGRTTHLAMTGVTALVRATAYQMEIRGISYPGEEVAAVLNAADLAHVSNEVSFVPDCPPPSYVGEPVFCSSPRYLSLLQEIGIDIVELTGNHLNDWGGQYLPYTLDLYDEAGMRYFGGGRDLAQAQEPLIVEHNGNRLAFVGCNPIGPPGDWATPERAGSAPCDGEAFLAQIRALKEAGYLVIATQQYQEIYHYAPTAQQQADFRALVDAGAAAVSGSQGHHAQGFDFYNGAFIHYGLGNLFFDQMDMMGTRQTFVDTYTIYDNRILSVQLWTGLIENYARPRLMSSGERRDLLQTLFSASGW